MTARFDVRRSRVAQAGFAVVAIFAVACGSKQPVAPTGPSAAVAPVATPGPAAATGATISGTVVTGASTASQWKTRASNLSVSVTGTSTASTVDDSGRFTLQNVPTGHVDLHFSGPGIDAHLSLDGVTEHAAITVTVRVSGSSAELDNDDREGPNNQIEVEGLVTSKSASTLTVNGRMIQTSATTVIVHGETPVALADIVVGDRVHAKGTSNGTTTGGTSIVLATRIEVQHQTVAPAPGNDDDDDDTGDDDDKEPGTSESKVELSGAISGLSGACPTLTFAISGTTVKTSQSTQFKDVSCSALKSGAAVQVKGTRQADKTVAASRVEKK